MAFDFPSSPTLGQQFSPVAGTTYTYNGYGWTSGGNTLSIAVQTFTASGTYTPRVGMQFCDIECVGGGGGGGGAAGVAGQAFFGGGGGAGGYSRALKTAAQIGASQTVTIGAGGIRGVGTTPSSGGNGGATSVGTLCVANGGQGGAPPNVTGGGAGGVVAGAVGDLVAGGAPGSGAGYFSGAQTSALPSIGGSSFFGGGGASNQGVNLVIVGTSATNYGAGGGGGSVVNVAGGADGGLGSAGVVIITEYVLIGSSTVVVGVAVPPQGRLTLQTATPVMITTQAAKTTIYYTPYQGNLVPIYDGTNFSMSAFSELSVLTTDTTKSPAAIGASKVNDWFVWNDAGTLRIGHGPDWTSDTVRSAGTALVMVNGIWLNNAAITNGPAASRGTYVGTTRSNASSQLDFIYGAIGALGTAGRVFLWNMYNRCPWAMLVCDSTDSWSNATQVWREANGSTTMIVEYVTGQDENTIDAVYYGIGQTTSQAARVGVGYDATNAIAPNSITATNAAATRITIPALFRGRAGLGYHFVAALEYGGSGVTYYGDFGSPGVDQSGFSAAGWY
jgi:hypothetical protein